MTGRRAVFVPLVALIAACQTARVGVKVAPSQEQALARATATGCDAVKERVDFLLETANLAAAEGDADEVHCCEAELFAALSACARTGAYDTATAAYLDEVLGDLELIKDGLETVVAADQAAEAGEIEEGPPEPLPVSPDQVVAEREKARAGAYDLPVVVNAEVTSLIEFYTGSYRERFAAAMERAARYLPYIRGELRRARLPLDLAYLPFVESAFNPRARSRARAQGLWQFVAGTARLYGLTCDRIVDERNDPFLATRAAVDHLAELDGMFGDWELSLAAYNSGPGRVRQALRRAKGTTDDFWKLRRFLPRETRNYVPAFWAVLVIVKNPSAYGFAPILEKPECLGRVKVAGALDLDVLAERAGLETDLLADINPALTYRMTPTAGSYQLAVPCGQEERYSALIAAIPHEQRVRSFVHVVRRGDTLEAIARRYGSSVATITAANGVRNPRALSIGRTLVIPRYPDGHRSTGASVRAARAAASSQGRAPTHRSGATRGPDRYRVERGDSLYAIARRFGMSVDRLRDLNGLTGNLIKPGQWLRLVSPTAS